MIRLNIKQPNLPGGAFSVNRDGIEGGYPAGTQCFNYVEERLICAIEPAPGLESGEILPGCYVHLHGIPTSFYCCQSADEVAEMVDKLKPNK
jgi:hypothetical protein